MGKSPYIQIEYINIYVLLNFGKDSCSINELMLMCPIAHEPHHLCTLPPMWHMSICSINQETPLPMCLIAHVPITHVPSHQNYVKLS